MIPSMIISTMPKGFNFSLFGTTSAREVPFGIPQYVQCRGDLPVSSFVSHSSLLTAKVLI